jgi:alpha-mannosidase
MADYPPRTLVVVSHTHWDREWYLPFERFRIRLVRTMDNLLDLLDRDPDYKHFLLDGQTIPLDDYLEIRPDRRTDVERLVRDGRLLIGPNYVLPDEFLIGAESWIRNLQIGIRSGRSYGRAMLVGYSPDAFGHIAHLPAILRGFGIDSVVIWRGVGNEATTSEFRWAAPDDSEVLAIHLPHGYGMMPVLPTDRSELANSLKNVRGLLEPLATTRYVLVPNGTDHLAAHHKLPEVIATANSLLSDARMVHGTYPMFVDAVKRELDGRLDSLPQLTGEFRSSARSHVLAGVLSARMWLKQSYQQCEDLLARYAEPLASWVHLLGDDDDRPERASENRGLLRHAWKLLLQNAPHDSVTGCSVDPVYDDVRTRFRRCQQIAESVIYDSQRHIADLVSQPDRPAILVFNSEYGPRTDFCTTRLPVQDGRLPVRLLDPGGAAVPLQLLQRGLRSPLDNRERVIAGFVAPDIPPFGYSALTIEYGASDSAITDSPGAVIENEHLRLTADPADGALAIEDKRTGQVLPRLNRFVDSGDRGDEYTYCPPARDRVVDQPTGPPRIRVTERGPARHTIEIRISYSLPAALTDDRDGRSSDNVDCEIVTRASLYPGVPRADIETEVDNRASDHRLRVLFLSGIQADHTHAEQHFGVVKRPIALPQHDGTWMETPAATYPQKTFVDVSDGARGLMLANRGLPEYEALREDDGTVTIALTLLRCVGWLSRGTDLKTRRGPAGPSLEAPGAQMLGRWSFQYAVIPHKSGWQTAFAEAHRFARPLRAIRTDGGSGDLPKSASLVRLEPAEAVLSSLKLAEDDDSLVLRTYNIAEGPIRARVRLIEPPTGVETVNLNEEEPQPTQLEHGSVSLPLRSNQIATLKFARTQRAHADPP